MSAAMQIARYELRDVARSRWLLAYTAFFYAATEGLVRFAGSGARAMVSVASLSLFLIPLGALIFGTIYVYQARELMELVLAQPVRRRALFAGLYAGLLVPLAAAFVVGVGVPFALHGLEPALRLPLAVLLAAGTALTAVFVALALVVAVRADDRLRGLGLAIGIWLTMAVLYDGLVLLLVAMFADHALERPMIAFMLANPIDLARVMVLLQLDVPALMGYTGAALEHVLGSAGGSALAAGALALWIAVPLSLAARAFGRRDF